MTDMNGWGGDLEIRIKTLDSKLQFSFLLQLSQLSRVFFVYSSINCVWSDLGYGLIWFG